MTLLWATPRVWATNEPVTQEKMNSISNQLTYLFTPTRKSAVVRGTGSNQTTASTTPVALDPANFTIYLELTGLRDVYVTLTGIISNSTVGASNKIDAKVDGTTYLSSLTASALNGGIKQIYAPVANYVIDISYRIRIPAGTLTAGFHTFVPYWWVSAGTATYYEVNQFTAFEVGEY